MRVITWQSPSGFKINICPSCEKHLAGQWPKDRKGEEYATVSHGLHRGACDTHSGIRNRGELAAEIR